MFVPKKIKPTSKEHTASSNRSSQYDSERSGDDYNTSYYDDEYDLEEEDEDDDFNSYE